MSHVLTKDEKEKIIKGIYHQEMMETLISVAIIASFMAIIMLVVYAIAH